MEIKCCLCEKELKIAMKWFIQGGYECCYDCHDIYISDYKRIKYDFLDYVKDKIRVNQIKKSINIWK